MWPSGNRSDFQSWRASATEPLSRENVIHDSAAAPFTALTVIGTAAAAAPTPMASAIRLQNGRGNGPSLRRRRRISHRINSGREALGRTILRRRRGAWIEVVLVRLRFRKR